jgi:type II secretory pathway pseudopilin PulG
MTIAGREIATRIIVMVVGAVILLIVASIALSQCSGRKTADKQAEVAKEQGQASVAAGQEAMNTVSNVAASDKATDDLVGMGQAEIAAATQGTKGKAAKRAACRLKSYVNSPQCR